MSDTETKRSYQQHCGLAKALDLVGSRWTLLIVRELLLGPRRWSQLLDALTGLTTNLLAKRLAELQDHGIIERIAARTGDPEPGRRGSYQLTARGRRLEPAVLELGRWGAETLAGTPNPGDRFELGWALISSKRRYARAANRPHLTLELGADQRRFQLRCGPGSVEIQAAASWPADVVLDGSLAAVLQLWMAGVPAKQLLASGQLSVVGDEEVLADILSSFAGIRWT